ncbi:MAG: M23 family metallopeptidase [Caldisericia bacterium]|nr:M23 family metallopeptidase [Caldisericia bacterium]
MQIKRELARIKMESDALDKFISQAKQLDKDASASLSLDYSTLTFPDFFRKHAKAYDASHNASTQEQDVLMKDKETIIKESAERQKTYRALMDVTPSGYPLEGKVLTQHSILTGPCVLLKAPAGTPIHATASGKVVEIEQTEKGYLIQIAHQNPNNNKSIRTCYHFCDKPTITLNQQVKKGQVIAYVGVLPGSSLNIMGYQVQIDRIYIQPK